LHVIGTAGHVDHGKSTLVERLTGIDPDRFAEEKERGLTIDLGFAWLTLPSGNEIGIVDVPGHERFIKNMLAGAGGVTVCLFVVAANEGWMPQSSEHLAIVDILGVSSGVIAVTKSDLVDADELDLVTDEVRNRMADTVLAGAPVVACSATTGDGIDELVATLDRVAAATPPAPDKGEPRLWVDRVFTIAGAGTVVTGTLAGGTFNSGDAVEIAPEGRKARIRAIQSHKKEVTSIGPGNRVALNLAGLDRQGAARGDAVVLSGRIRPTRRIDVQLSAVPRALGGPAHDIVEKGAHLLYVGSAETPVRINLLGLRNIGPGEDGYAQLTLSDALPVLRGDRFVLRDAGRVITIGGGVVLDPAPEPAKRTDTSHVERLAQLLDAAPADALRVLVASAGRMTKADALGRVGTATGGGAGIDDEAGRVDVAGVIELGDVFVSGAELARLERALEEELDAYHDAHPLEQGMPRELLRAAIGLEMSSFEALIARTTTADDHGTRISRSGHRVELAPEQEKARAALLERIGVGGFTPPMGKDLGADPALLRALVDSGELVKIGDFYLTAERAREARTAVRTRIETSGPVTVAEIRDLLGTSRKYAVPLCEWLDATGATRRHGDERILGPHE
jgi:selenocysteine-specific elongation factor